MLSTISQKKLIAYWKETAADSYATMEYLYKGKRYADALFFGHLVLEKLLKGIVVEYTQRSAPYIHNLIELWEMGGQTLDPKVRELLTQVNRFNVRARYPDDKLAFHKQCTSQFTQKYFREIQSLYYTLCQHFKKNAA